MDFQKYSETALRISSKYNKMIDIRGARKGHGKYFFHFLSGYDRFFQGFLS